jgi:hypothetical protein
MTPFGKIKSKIEFLFESTYKTESFKENIKDFKHHVLDKKNICEIYYLYDKLTKKSNINESIVDDYINDSFEVIKSNLESSKKDILELSKWINEKINEEVDSIYTDIDNIVYSKNTVKNLESILLSKNKIKESLLSNNPITENKSLNIPVSSMLKIANKTLSQEYSDLNESEVDEIKYYSSLNKKELIEEIENTKTLVIDKLRVTLNESVDEELNKKIESTIEEINNNTITKHSLYKLKQLEKGL